MPCCKVLEAVWHFGEQTMNFLSWRIDQRYHSLSVGASQTVNATCYDTNGKPRRYLANWERRYSWGSAKEDYVLPDAHTVVIQIPPDKLADATGDCFWAWQQRKAGGKAEQKKLPCKD